MAMPLFIVYVNFLYWHRFVFRSKVITAFLESSSPDVKEMAKEELQPLVENGDLSLPNLPTDKQD